MDIQTQDGILLRGIPDGTPDDVIKERIAKIRGESATGSDGQNFAAGIGAGLTNAYRGVKQLSAKLIDLQSKLGIGPNLPEMSPRVQAEIDEAKRLDKPLMDTKAGFGGNLLGATVPFLAAPVAATIPGAAAIGGAMGAMAPVASDESRAMNTGLGALGGAGGQYLGQAVGNYLQKSGMDKLAELLASKNQNTVKDATLAASKEAGYRVPPSMQGAGMTARFAEGLSGKYKTNQAFGIENQKMTDALARKALGLPDDAPLTSEMMQAIRKQAAQTGYEPLTGAGRVTTDDYYQQALNNIIAKHQGAAADFPGVASSAVTDFVEGAGKKTAIPPRSAFVDSMGNIVDEAAIPQTPKVRNLIQELKAAGGLHVGEQGDLGIEKLNKAVPGLLNKKGQTADDLVEWMTGNGWLSKADAEYADKNVTGGAQGLAHDLIRSAVNKEDVIHPANRAAWDEFQTVMRELDQQGVKKITIPGETAADAGLRVKSFDAGNAIKMTQILRNEADGAFRNGDSALGRAKKDAAKAIEDQIERHLASDGAGAEAADMLKNFREARVKMAVAHTVEDAVKEGTGHVNAVKLAQRFQAGKPLTGELKTIGQFANTFPEVARLPKSGDANPFTVLDFAGAGFGSALSPLAAMMPLGRVAARQAILSKPAQAMMGPNYDMSMLAKLLADPKTAELLKRGTPALGMAGALYGPQQ